jgi:hypothetical protein
MICRSLESGMRVASAMYELNRPTAPRQRARMPHPPPPRTTSPAPARVNPVAPSPRLGNETPYIIAHRAGRTLRDRHHVARLGAD